MQTEVVHCRQELFDVFIGRPSEWGNPFMKDKHGSRAEVIQKYRAWIVTQPRLMAKLPQLKGKILGCYCKPLACHGDVLAELADATNGADCPDTSRGPASS